VVLDIDNTVDVVAQIEIISKGRSLMNVQTALSQKADYRVTMEFNLLTGVPAI
jgi:hypothetical protein